VQHRLRSAARTGHVGQRAVTAVLAGGLGIAAVALPPGAGASSGAVISVHCYGATGGIDGLQAAITSANASGGGTISLGACTYSARTPDTTGADGSIALPVITSPITIVGHGAEITESGASSQLIEVDGPGSLTANYLTLRGGRGCSGGALGIGSGASAALAHVTMTEDTAGGQPGCNPGANVNTGGAVNDSGTLTVRRSNFSDDAASGFDACGGAIADLGGTVMVADTEFSGNTAEGYAAAGGAVCSIEGASPVVGTFSNDTFTDNSATPTNQFGGRPAGGGAVFSEASSETISQSSFSDNSAAFGGAVFSGGVNAAMLLSDDLMNANSASFAGGGVTDYDGTAALVDDTLTGNEAGFGTAILSGGYDTMTSDTIVDNTAVAAPVQDDQGDVIDTASLRGTLTLSGTLIAANNGRTCYGSGVTDGGYNIADDSTCAFTAATSTSDSATIDGDLLPLGNYGGPTETVPTLVFGQIPVNNVLCATPDQRGVPRTSPFGCDIGAFQSTLTSTMLSAPRDEVPPLRAVKLWATVAGNYSASIGIRGTVTFMEGTVVLGTVTPSKRGVALYTIPGGTLPGGVYSFSASFAGPIGYQPSTSPGVFVFVR
jgi:hypothetical protein